mgnify:FL=1
MAEGGNHLIHASRRNQDITVILHDNAIYGLTTGQTSPRSSHGYKSKSTPLGNIDQPLNPLALAIAAGATFVARVYSGDLPRLTEMLVKANKHKGFAVVQVLQPCVTFNKEYSHIFFQENIYQLDEKHNIKDKRAAFAKTLEWGIKQIPVGVFYEASEPTCEEQTLQIKDKTLVEMPIKKRDIDELLKFYQ